MKLELNNEDLKTLSQCTNSLKRHGFDKDFTVTEEGLKTTEENSKIYKPEDVRIVNFYRFEGDSDPGDMSILYVIETCDGVKGSLVDAYGPYASRKVSDFIVQVQEIQKKTDRKSGTITEQPVSPVQHQKDEKEG
jgi:hypothetical protein